MNERAIQGEPRRSSPATSRCEADETRDRHRSITSLRSRLRYHPTLSPNHHNGYPQYHTLHQSGAYRGDGGGGGGGGSGGSGGNGYYTYNPHQSQYGANYYNNSSSNEWNHLPASPASPSGVRRCDAMIQRVMIILDCFRSWGCRAEIATCCYFCCDNFIKNAFAMFKST